MSNFKAIETIHKGYKFRSRLEARWAVFFDYMNYCWEYEPEGFEGECSNGDYVKYLPDFKLYPMGKDQSYYFWVEVKGDPLFLKNNWQKLENMLDFNPILPDIKNCFDNTKKEIAWCQNKTIISKDPCHGLILLPDIPNFRSIGEDIWFTCLGHHEGVCVKTFKFNTCFLDFCPSTELLSQMDDGDFSFQPKFYTKEDMIVLHSFDQAKQARFEYGANP